MIVRQDDARIDVTLSDAIKLAGFVVDENNKPLANVGVSINCGTDFTTEPQVT